MRIWLLLFCLSAAASVQAGPQKVCLDEQERFCAWEENPTAEHTVVLVHGLNGNALRDWQAQLDLLSKRYHVLAISLPGFEQELSESADHYSMDYFSEVLHRFTSRYVSGSYYLVGHSMGGVIALRHALQYPNEVTRLVLADLPGILHRISYARERVGNWARGGTGEHAGFPAFLEKMTVKLLASGEHLSGTDASANDLLLGYTDDPFTLASMQVVRQDFSGQLQGMTTPTLLIWGAMDMVAPLRTGYALNARLPNARLEVIPKVGHMPMRDTPEAFNRTLLAFLDIERPQPHGHTDLQVPAEGDISGRVGVCHNRSGEVYEGPYKRIELHSCDRVVIRNALVGTIEARNSRFSVRHSRLGGSNAPSMWLHGSDAKVTASYLEGETVMYLDGSRVDVAGTYFQAEPGAIEVAAGSELLFSISQWLSAGAAVALHGFYELERERFPSRQQ